MISALPRLSLVSTASALAFATATPAAAGDGTQKHYYSITLQEGRIAAAAASADGSAAKVDGFTVKQGVKSYKLDRVFVKSWSTSGDAGAPTVGPNGLIAASGTQAHSPPSGIRQLVFIAQKGAACTVGKRYSSATLTGGGKSYRFTDVTITGCGRSAAPEENITFVYGKLIVK